MSDKGKIIVISGPSGSGKNTVYDGLAKRSDDIVQTVSATTRSPRSNEKNGIDYYFMSEEDFLNKVNNDDFVEYVKYGTNYYGTLKSEVNRLLNEGKKVILVIEVNGALRIKKTFPDAITIFLLPPSVEELKRRIVERGENSESEISSRLSIAENELKLKDKYDYRVINDNLDNCINTIYDIIENL